MGNFSNEKADRREEIKAIYESKRQEIELRLNDFKIIWKKGKKKEIFAELVFCILTPQANGKLCWSAVENMIRKGVVIYRRKEPDCKRTE